MIQLEFGQSCIATAAHQVTGTGDDLSPSAQDEAIAAQSQY